MLPVMGWRNRFKKLARQATGGALAPVTGGASLGLLSDDMTDKAKELLVGQDPNDVKVPPEVAAAQARRQQLVDMALGGSATASQDAAREAASLAGRTARTDLANRLQSAAAGARGLGALGARREAMRRTALGEADIAGRVAEGSANAVANAVGQDAARRLQQIGTAAELLTDQERAALEAEEYRKKNARKGVAGEVGAIVGTIGGGIVGGPAGAKTGGEIGYGAGNMIERY
jgi:hypothetical protein